MRQQPRISDLIQSLNEANLYGKFAPRHLNYDSKRRERPLHIHVMRASDSEPTAVLLQAEGSPPEMTIFFELTEEGRIYLNNRMLSARKRNLDMNPDHQKLKESCLQLLAKFGYLQI